MQKKLLSLLFFISLLFVAVSCLSSNTTPEKEQIIEDNSFTITCVPTFYGNDPFIHLGLLELDIDGKGMGVYYIHPDYVEDFKALTGHKLEVTGYLYQGEDNFPYDIISKKKTIIPISWEEI